MFCCGCSLKVGVCIILGCHLLACVVYVAVTFSSLVLHMHSFDSAWGPSTQMALAALYLSGIPIILSALIPIILSGARSVTNRTRASLQFYLAYLSVCLVIDSIVLIHAFMWQDACTTTGSFIKMLGEDFGAAAVCGFTRIASWSFTIAALSLEVYCVYVVWSLCEKMRVGTSLFEELMPGADEAFKKKHSRDNGPKDSAYTDIIGLAHHKVQGPYPSPYGATGCLAAPNYKLWDGTDHDTNYPPRPRKDDL